MSSSKTRSQSVAAIRKETSCLISLGSAIPALENSILAWGARAIFHPSDKYPLDILWDRQGHKFDPDTQKDAYRQFGTFINQTVLPKLQELAHYFSPSDHEKFVCHFDWPHDPSLLVVATGSPNGSYGYF